MNLRLLIGGLLLASQILVRADTTVAQVKSVQGGDAYVIFHGHSQLIVPNMTLAPGSLIRTDTGTVGIHLMPGADTVVAPHSTLRISTLDYSKNASGQASRTVLLDLSKGTVFSALVHGDGVSSFNIKTPKGVAAARGTHWECSVGRDHDGIVVTIRVVDGNIVFISIGGGHVNIGPGHGYSSRLNLVFILTPQEIQAIIRALIDAGFTVTVGFGNGGPGNGGNPGTTTSPEQ